MTEAQNDGLKNKGHHDDTQEHEMTIAMGFDRVDGIK
jgi:hypothetical protein